MRARRRKKRGVKRHHSYGGGFAAAHRAKAAVHEGLGGGKGSSVPVGTGGVAGGGCFNSGGPAASCAADSSAAGASSCNSSEDWSGWSHVKVGCLWGVLCVMAILLLKGVLACLGGVALCVATHQVFHRVCMRLGLAKSSCIRLRCCLNGRSAAALLDSGATHCFVDRQFAELHMGLRPVKLLEPASFRTANGMVKCADVYPNVRLKLGGFRAVVTLVPIDLGFLSGGGDAFILGADFLKRYNPVIDWQEETVRIGSYVLPDAEDEEPKVGKATSSGLCDDEDKLYMCTKLQAKRLLRKGGTALRCYASVKEEEEESFMTEIEGLVDSICHPSVKGLLLRFASVFAEPSGVPPERPDCPVEHPIDMEPGSRAPARPAYKMSQEELTTLRAFLKDLSDKGFIRRSSSSFAAPVVLVRKPAGGYRFVCDYRGLNSVSVKQAYPLPNCDLMFEQLSGAKWFTKMDLTSGFHQIRMRAGDEYKTAFITRYGLWEWVVMPMGLCGAPSTFQRAMNTLFSDLLDQGVMVYVDDILLYADTLEEHNRLLEVVLERLKANGFHIRLHKCMFGQQEMPFLGHVLTPEGLKPGVEKLKSVTEWPVPTTASELRSFVFLCSYYRKFVFQFAKIAAPLHDLTKGNFKGQLGDKWSPECQAAFEQLKEALVSAPVLRYVQMGKPMHLACDASDFAISGVLSQEFDGVLHPVGYYSRKLRDVETRYAVRDRELLAIVEAVKWWHHLLEGVPVHVLSDHESLSTFLKPGTKLISQQHKRWLDVLQGLDMSIKHIAGKDNVVPDLLSRRTDYALASVQLVQANILQSVQEAGALDPAYAALGSKRNFSLVDGVVYERKGKVSRVVVPNSTELRELLMFEAHMASGHGGSAKTLGRLTGSYWWRGIAADVRAFCKGCHVCQVGKRATGKPAGLLQSLPVPTEKFQFISIDQVVGMPLCQGFDAFITCTDLLTKYVVVIPCATTDDAVKCAQLMHTHVFKVFGLPLGILSDRDPKYTSAFWGGLFASLGTKLHLTTAFRPQADGQSERTNQTVEQVLRCLCLQSPGEWVSKLPDVCEAINGNVHASTGVSPARLLFGFQPRTALDVGAASAATTAEVVPAAADMLAGMQKDVQLARQQLAKAKQWQKSAYDRHHKNLSFKVGDKVMLSSQNINLQAAACRKLKPRWLGPFVVRSVVSPVSYEIELPRGLSRLHPVFHVSLLKAHIRGSKLLDTPVPEPVLVDGQEEHEVEAIVKHKVVGKGRKYLVAFKDFPLYEAEWLREDELENAPDILREYKRAHGLV